MLKTKYLIIGNSAAAIGGIMGIRSIDPDGAILLVSDEPHHTYSRPLISYWLEGKVSREQMVYREHNFYEKNAVQTKLGVKAIAVNPEEKSVTLADGEVVSYEKLLIATGSQPFVPPIKGKDTAVNAFTFTKLADAEKIGELLSAKSNVVILGAGLIGLKAAEAVVKQAASVTVLDLADRVLPSVLDQEAGEIVANHLIEADVDLCLETSIEEIGDGEVTLNNGETIPYDILILAVGTRPATALAEAAGLSCGRGIVTDAAQLTGRPDVYAAGDCTQSHDISSGEEKNMAILPNAFMQGETAGINMAGGQAIFEQAFPLNSLGLMGLYMLTAGSYRGEPIVSRTADSFKKFYVEDNRLRGYIVIGDCQRGGIYTDLIREEIDLSTLDFAGLMAEPTLSAFAPASRYDKLSAEH